MYEAIKAEIERIKRNLLQLGDMRFIEEHFSEQAAIIRNCEHLLSFIESMEKEESEFSIIKGWVARDSHVVNDKLYMFYDKPPIKAVDCYVPDKSTKGARLGQLPKELFHDLRWDDGPIEVELIIKSHDTR